MALKIYPPDPPPHRKKRRNNVNMYMKYQLVDEQISVLLDSAALFCCSQKAKAAGYPLQINM